MNALSIYDLQTYRPIGLLIIQDQFSERKKELYIYSNFKNTINYLNERNIPIEKGIKDYDIISIKKNIYYEINRFDTVLYKQELLNHIDDINKIKNKTIYFAFNTQPVLNPINKNEILEIRIKNIDNKYTLLSVKCYLTYKPKN